MKPITDREAKKLIKEQIAQEKWNLALWEKNYNASLLKIAALESQITSKY